MLVAVLSLTRITSRQNPLVARLREAARGEGDRILLDGTHLLIDAFHAGVSIDIAVVAADRSSDKEVTDVVERLLHAGVKVSAASPSVMAAMSPVSSASAIVALARAPQADPAQVYGTASPVVAIACDVQDPGNLGAIVRVAEAAAASGVVTTARSADPFGWKALRGSMGSALRLPLLRRPSIDAAVDEARRHGCRVVATAPRGGRPLFETPLGGGIAVLIGAEGAGLPDALVDAADERVTIPMRAPVESLNAAVTAALMLYEIARQRRSARPARSAVHGV